MAEQIDELMVKLGLETDSKDFNDANQMFDQLQSRVLQLGAVIGTGFGLQSLTTDFIAHNRELSDLAETYGTTEQFISSLGFAIDQSGGQFEDAFGSVRRMRDLLESTDWGEFGGDVFREGFDPMRIQEAESLADAYTLIAEGLQGMDAEAARRSLSALGFGEAEIRLLRQGPERMGELLAQGEALRPQTPEMGELATELDQAMGRLQTVLGGVGDQLSLALLEDRGIANAIDDLTEWLSENQQAIREFADDAVPILTGMATALGALVAIQGGRAALGAFANIPGAVALTAGIGAAIQHGLGEEDASIGGSIFRRAGERGLVPEPDPDTENRSLLENLIFGPGGPGTADDVSNIGPDSQSMRGGGTRMEFRIDARGSTSPMETERAARRGVEAVIGQLAENTLTDIRGNIA